MSATEKQKERNRRKLDSELDILENRMEELKVQFEQYFIDVLPQPPDLLQREVARTIRRLLKAPFKNAAVRFRLRALIQRFASYRTYWERTLKEKEEGRYRRDVYKAEYRERSLEEERRAHTREGAADKAMKQLYNSYQEALKAAGATAKLADFDGFKKSLMEKAKKIKEKTGASKLKYSIVMKDGKVVVKATAK